jgi:hypothetical protein
MNKFGIIWKIVQGSFAIFYINNSFVKISHNLIYFYTWII